MKITSQCCAAGLALFIAAATAAGARADSLPGDPQADPTAQAQVQALIDSTDEGASVFRAGATGEVVHIQSGMVCLRGDEAMSLTRLLVTPGVALGDDVGCDYVTPGGKLTIYATRRGSLTLNSYVDGILDAIARLYPSATPTDGPMVMMYDGISEPVAGAFAISIDDKPYITSVWISEERDWLVEVRATYPAEPRHDPEFLAALSAMWAQKTIQESSADQVVPDGSAPRLRPRSADD